jgi:hypothetical protein
MLEDLHAYLKADTLTHDVVADQIFWVAAPQGTSRPYMTYFVNDDPHAEFAFGSLDASQSRIMVNVYSTNPYLSLSIGNTIRGRLEQYQGTMNSNTSVESIRCSGTRVIRVAEHDFFQGTFDAMVNYYDT